MDYMPALHAGRFTRMAQNHITFDAPMRCAALLAVHVGSIVIVAVFADIGARATDGCAAAGTDSRARFAH